MRLFLLPVLVALVAGYFLWPASPVRAPRRLGFSFPAGELLLYRLEHTGRHRVAPLGGLPPMEAEADLACEVVVRGLGPVEDRWRFALSFGHFERRKLVVGGHDALGDPAAWRGLEAVVEVTDAGEVRGISFPPEAPHVFRNLVQLVVSEVQVRLGVDEVAETTQHGVARSRYTGGPKDRRRSRTHYDRLQALGTETDVVAEVDGHATARLADGHLAELTTEERVKAGTEQRVVVEANSRTHFALVSVGRGDPEPPRSGRSVALGEAAAAPDREARMLADRVAGLTGDALKAMLAGAAHSGRLPDHNRTLWRAVGLLRSDPELCAELGERAADEDLNSTGRALVLDLLTSAGTGAAQAALRAALSADTVRADPKFPILFQRLSLLTTPDAETLAYLEAAYADPGPVTLGAATFALGAAAGQAVRAGEGRGRVLAAKLVSDLQTAESPDAQALRLIALGNAGLPEYLGALLPFTQAEHPEVRRAAAAALRKIDRPEAREALLGLAGDTEVRVQRRALEALAQSGAGPADLPRLQTLGATLAEPSLDLWVDLITPHAHTPEGRAALGVVLARDLRDARVKSRIRALLGEG